MYNRYSIFALQSEYFERVIGFKIEKVEKYNVCICLKFWAAKSIKSKFERGQSPSPQLSLDWKAIHAMGFYLNPFYGCFYASFCFS